MSHLAVAAALTNTAGNSQAVRPHGSICLSEHCL